MRRLILVLAALVALPLAGCGGTADPLPSETAETMAESSAGYPLTLPQEGGELRLDKAPERVYVVDNWSLDIVAGLGVRPVGAAVYFPPSPWLADSPQVSGVPVETITDAVPLEKIAAARPDLIVALSGSAGEDPGAAEKLRAIAPVLYSPKDWLTDGWRDRLRHAATAMGRTEAAETAIGQTEKVLGQIRSDQPELAGASLTFARHDPPTAFALVVDDSDFTRSFLNTELGVRTPKAQTEAYDAGRFEKVGGVLEGVSLERGDLIDADAAAALIWFQDDANLEALERQQAWRQIPVVADGRLVPMDINAAIALRTPTPASIAWMADNLLPQLAAAVAKAA